MQGSALPVHPFLLIPRAAVPKHAHRHAASVNGLLPVLLILVLTACQGAIRPGVVDADDTEPPPVEPPVVTITAEAESVTEGSPVRFMLTAAPAPVSSLQVSLTWEQTGSWLAGTPPSTVTIPEAGTNAVEVPTEDDSVDESDGQVRVQVTVSDGYEVGDPNQATVAVTDNDDSNPADDGGGPAPRAPPRRQPVVTIVAESESVTEGTPVRFTLAATPAPTAPLQVGLSWEQTGSWLAGEPSSAVTISTSGSAQVQAETDDNAVLESNGEVRVTVNPGPGYSVVEPTMATVHVTDNDTPTVTIVAEDDLVYEGRTARFTLTATPAPQSPLPVGLNWTGNPVRFIDDYPPAVTIDTDGTATLQLKTRDFWPVEGRNETRAEIASGDGYRRGDPASARVVVDDRTIRVFSVSPNPIPNRWQCRETSTQTVTLQIAFYPPTTKSVQYSVTLREFIFRRNAPGRYGMISTTMHRTAASDTSIDEFEVSVPIRDPTSTNPLGHIWKRYYTIASTTNNGGYTMYGWHKVWVRAIIYGPHETPPC